MSRTPTAARRTAAAGVDAMATAVLAAPRRFVVREAPIPEPAGGEARIRVEGCGVCGSDLAPWRGASWFEYPREPGMPGHEAWGRVEVVGPGVTALREGDRVACLGPGGFADRMIVRADEVVPIPDELGSSPFPGEPLACAVNVVARAGIGRDMAVAVVGCGFLGCLLVELAARRGAGVVGLSVRRTSLRAAMRRGAVSAIAMDADHAVETAIEAVGRDGGDDGFDVVLEAAGRQATLDVATRLTRSGGRLVVAGYHQDGPRSVDMQVWNWRGLDVINAHERRRETRRTGLRRAVRLAAAGALDPAPLLTHAVELPFIDRAFRLLEERPPGFMKAWVRP